MSQTNAKNYVQTFGFQPFGLYGSRVEIECQAILALPQLTIIGIPTNHAIAMRERILNALSASGFALPDKKITVSIRFEAQLVEPECLDLPVAVAILASMGKILAKRIELGCFIGVLGLNGAIHSIQSQQAVAAFLRIEKFDFVAMSPEIYFRWKKNMDGGGFSKLPQLVSYLSGEECGEPPLMPSLRNFQPTQPEGVKFLALHGQETAKRAATIAAAGAHHLLMAGPRGAGKTSFAEAIQELLPLPTDQEWEQILAIHSVVGAKSPNSRPFRSPHFTVTQMALLGGGVQLSLGECSLAHQGILFLDELLEFPKALLEQLRLPLESRDIVLARGTAKAIVPAGFQLIAATNLSPCGLLGHPKLQPKSSHGEIQRYQKRLSQALRDRIDLQVELIPEIKAILNKADSSPQKFCEIRKKVELARKAMLSRQGKPNAWLGENVFNHTFDWNSGTRKLLNRLVDSRTLSARATIGLARVARTIADLEQRTKILEQDILEASFFRQDFVGMDMKDQSEN